jgi:hypothetical protein
MADLGAVPCFSTNCRQGHEIGVGRCPKVFLGLGATALTRTAVWVEKRAKPQEGVIGVDDDAARPRAAERDRSSAPDRNGEGRPHGLGNPVAVASGGQRSRGETVRVATDGDPGTNAWHKAPMAAYHVLLADARVDHVIETLETRERLRTRIGWEMTVTDMVHWSSAYAGGS